MNTSTSSSRGKKKMILKANQLRKELYRGEVEKVSDDIESIGGFEGEILRGELNYIKGKYLQTVEFFEKALMIAENAGNRRWELAAIYKLIHVCLKAGLKRKAEEYLGKGVALLRYVRNSEEKSGFLISHALAISHDIGFIESEKYSEKLVSSALMEIDEAEKKLEESSPLYLRGEIVRGVLLQQMGEWGKAEEVLRRAELLSEREGYIFLEGELLEERGNLHLRRGEEGEEGQFKEAMEAYSRALRCFKDINLDEVGVLHSGLGDAAYSLKEYEDSLKHHTLALEIFRKLNYIHGIGLELASLGRIHLRIGERDDLRGEVKKGIGILKKALRLFKKLDLRHEIVLTEVYLTDGYFLLSGKKGKKFLRKLLYNRPIKQYDDCYRELKKVVFREEWLREDPEFAEIFLKPLPKYITLRLMEEIIQSAKKAHPHEFGALLHGDPVISRMEFVPDSSQGKNTFMFSLYNRYSGEYITADGVVHSHPSGSALPSKADLSFFGRFPGINIIIAYPYTLDSWAAYDRNGNKVKVKLIHDEG